MNKDELKRLVCEYLDSHSDELIRQGEELLRIPELAFALNMILQVSRNTA